MNPNYFKVYRAILLVDIITLLNSAASHQGKAQIVAIGQDGAFCSIRTALIALPAFITQGVICYINRGRLHWEDAFHLPDYLLGIWSEGLRPNRS
jgi:hypothetical protein